MKKIAYWNKRSDFTKNIVKLISGTFIAQIISIAISPILSRIYSPEDFGLFTLVSSIYAFVALVAGGRYEQAILLPKRHTEAANIFVLAIFINFLFALLFFCGLLVFDQFYPIQNLGIWYYLLPLFICIVGCTQSVTSWYNRRKKYGEIASYKITVSFLNNGLSLVNGWIKINPNGLLMAFLVSNFLSLGILVAQLKSDWRVLKRSISWRQMRRSAKRYVHFPLLNSFQSLLDAFQINGVIYLISFLFGAYSVGIFSMALRILFVPMNFIGGSISQVFYQEANENQHKGISFIPLMKKTSLRSLLIIAPIILTILLFGPQLFAFVFGEKWFDAGVYAQYLAPWILFDFIRAPLSQIPLILGKQKNMLFFSSISNLIILLIVFFGSTYLKDLEKILFILSCAQSVYLIGLIAWIFKIAQQADLSSHTLNNGN